MTLDVLGILSPGGAVARRLDGFESRPQQIEMASAISRSLEERGRLLVEAGTGVGKSFAYLVPAIERIVEHHERVVVSTHTISLQEQLIERDIPLLSAVIPGEFSAVLVKGRGNYVSLRRLRLASERQERLFPTESVRSALHELEQWAYETRDGTLASLPRLPRGEVWDHAQSDAHNCMGKKCPTYEKCFYQQARRRMENGDLLVCNHALFFADLALRSRGVGFLPPYDHVILDEAHCVEEVAAEHFGLSLAESRVAHLLRVLYDHRHHKGFLAVMRLADGSTNLVDHAIESVLDCHRASDELFTALERWRRESGGASGRVREAAVVENTLTAPMTNLADLLRILRTKAATEADQFELASYAVRAMEIATAAKVLIEQAVEGCVYFVEGGESRDRDGESGEGRSGRGRAHGGGRGRRLTLRCVTVDVAPVLREQLFGRKISVVMTSATLATARGDFGHVARRLGCEEADRLHLGSPFDHARQMRVVIDRSMPAPDDFSWADRLAARAQELVAETDGGAFILFTSFAALARAARALRAPLAARGHTVLVHGEDGPPGLLLRRFREDRRSVLLGTMSFWQGVDVRGEGLRNVIITRLPFDVPERPIVEARHERIRAEGGNPFTEDQVPRAVIRFRQGVGRLIRSKTDTGLVAVLDPRIVTRPYGRAFIDALPEGVSIDEG